MDRKAGMMRYTIEMEVDTDKPEYDISVYMRVGANNSEEYQMRGGQFDSLSKALTVVNEVPIIINKLMDIFKEKQ